MGEQEEKRTEHTDHTKRIPGDNWTEEQWRAISCRGSKVLVAAGAGAGKTRVLVERVLQRVTDEFDPVEIDRLLVVTFTNAAAAEMKQRIGSGLGEAIKENPHSSGLRRQLLVLNQANITTIHSFCMGLLKSYYYLCDLDPAFRILDQTEAELLRQELLEDLLEEFYDKGKAGTPFYRLADAHSSDRGDEKLQKLVEKVYNFSRSHPWPMLWLAEMAACFSLESIQELSETSWVKFLRQSCRQGLQSIIHRLSEAIKLAEKPGGPAPYLKNLTQEREAFKEAYDASACSWDELDKAIRGICFGRLAACKGEEYLPELKKSASRIRNSCKKDFVGLKDEIFQRSLPEQLEDLNKLATVVEALVEVIQAFDARYYHAKKEKGVLDFSDLEHFALKILLHPDSTPEKLLPSLVSLDCRERFREVLVDEYQDINAVQEAILQMVSRPEAEAEGNLFMVGDVKQSIYRFRLAEPGLFLQKQKEFSADSGKGEAIDLRHNFRTRWQILTAVNFIFRQIMDEAVGEINYDVETELVYGASYPESEVEEPGGFTKVPEDEEEEGKVEETGDRFAVDFLCIDRSLDSVSEEGLETEVLKIGGSGDGEDAGESEGEGMGSFLLEEESDRFDDEEWETANLEGRLIARKIKELLGGGIGDKGNSFLVFDKERRRFRPLMYRDIVILLRAAQNWAPAILEELRKAGIPAYAEVETGYFEATEVGVMLSLLKVIDNPFQDLPLVAVLRSPIVGLSAEELAQLRLAAPRKSYYEAMQASDFTGTTFCDRLKSFKDDLVCWQEEARQGVLADLIWRLYRDTGYYDLVGGMPGGEQRQANLRVLYDRARQYEATSFRGLFRFLRFVERLRSRGGDLGPARAIGEQEDLVRVLTIHKSKGLEFPVVFVAGLAKQFNRKDLSSDFLLHRELGFGLKFIDTEMRLIYPTLSWVAVKKRLQLELLAEEMRILYVALTRAEEKLFLVATVKDLRSHVERWGEFLDGEERQNAVGVLPFYYRAHAKSYLDWIGAALIRHPQAVTLRETSGTRTQQNNIQAKKEGSVWQVSVFRAQEIIEEPGERRVESERQEKQERQEGQETQEEQWWEQVANLEPIPFSGGRAEEIDRCLSWSYAHKVAPVHLAKLSVSELKNHWAAFLPEEELGVSALRPANFKFSLLPRPRFLGKQRLTAVERGSAYHAVMQHIFLDPPLTEERIRLQIEQMVAREQLTLEEKDVVDPALVARFFATPLGQRMLQALEVRRELFFSMVLPAAKVYSEWPEGESEENVIVQGVIDCLLQEKDGFVLIDFKTGMTVGSGGESQQKDLQESYALQLDLYAQAVEKIWKRRVKEKYLYFF